MAPSQQPPARRKDQVLSRSEISDLIAAGRKIVIVDDAVLKVDAWLPYHPGGDKAILHMVGRDATNEVKAFHSAETLEVMRRYQIGKIEGQWRDYVPPIQGGLFKSEQEGEVEEEEPEDNSDVSPEPSPIFDAVVRQRRRISNGSGHSSATSLSDMELDALSPSKRSTVEEGTQKELLFDLEKYPNLDQQTQGNIIVKYQLLDQKLRDEKMYDCNYTAYAFEIARYCILASISYYTLQKGFYVLSALFLGMLWHQLVFTVHDAGHMGITHNYTVDTLISIFIADFLGGLSACWWKHNHNVHHIITNHPEHDPDIQHMPFFAISTKFFGSLTSTYYDRVMEFDAAARRVLRYQHWLYFPILTFGRFNLYVLSWQHILLGKGPRKGPAWWHRYLEFAGQCFFWYWFGYGLLYKSLPNMGTRIAYLLISHAITMPVHAQITLSHFAMSTADLGVKESFPQRMLRTTMDIACPTWLDWFHGGLQFQAVHHLFPRMPRHNLRKASEYVKAYCEEVGIPYAVYGFVEGNGKVIGRLGEVAQQARILSECTKSMSGKDVFDEQ
ncbi:hypothetical protein LTR56_009977 [Elasticomyces elasticus]|nr:hypothetical protein LTR56_009977 [Elasticomyces elasticus]KAK3656174.1 hypothetical protein LTR22_009881 [Elasticomyces elasticus]KAK4933765.1 hypothetical protein LTR49_000231 [Elasticomyces elasticus]KAK5756519.1 hypothetical protein LTS12_013354 [Elasticomyces elasticus]